MTHFPVNMHVVCTKSFGSISNFATGSFKFLFALIQVSSKVFNLEAIGCVYLISSQAFSKDRTNLIILFHLSNIHNMFRHLPWSHGIWFATDNKNVVTTRSNFHFLSVILRESENWSQSRLKISTPQGWHLLPSLSLLLGPLLKGQLPGTTKHWPHIAKQ